MKVILLKDIPKVGRKNEVKDVSEGFARNFLIRQNLAKSATDGAVKTLSREQKQKENAKDQERKKYMSLVDKLNLLEVVFRTKMGEKGKAFGSINVAKIQEELRRLGVTVEKEWIQLDDPIKTTGEHRVVIKFPGKVTGEVKVLVKPE